MILLNMAVYPGKFTSNVAVLQPKTTVFLAKLQGKTHLSNTAQPTHFVYRIGF